MHLHCMCWTFFERESLLAETCCGKTLWHIHVHKEARGTASKDYAW